ncbi:hypothetical protein FRC03_008942 [Tulasnella sp. 419]|nr:hypothetical protein FRC03_008942 [Tulasnella sp. 419]
MSTSNPVKPKDKFNYNRSPLAVGNSDEVQHQNFRRVTAEDLASYRSPPKRIKMLTRDFIHDSLYNPHYGYFPKQAVIFSPEEAFDFERIENIPHFQEIMAARYADHGMLNAAGQGPGRQIWHTPTELFKPHYGRAIAECLVQEYMLHYFPYEDLVIYEMGAGNGTMAQNILDYIRDEYPDTYERTRYSIIEISKSLAELQTQKLSKAHPCVEIVNQSVFDWKTLVPTPCFFLALEVIDNFPHDVIRYDLQTLQPLQSMVAIDSDGDFSELYEPVHDPLILRYLSYRSRIQHQSPALSSIHMKYPSLRSVYRNLPFSPNLTPKPEFIPTRLLSFLEVLRERFPLHRLLLSDFSSLPDTMPGYNAPVVQTRYRDTMIPVETYMVQPGYFDIFFPTSFEELRDMYELVMSLPRKSARTMENPEDPQSLNEADSPMGVRPSPLSYASSSLRLGSNFFSAQGRRAPEDGANSSSGLAVGQRMSSVYTHKEFMSKYANLEATRLRNGENAMLDFYQNVKFLF